MGKVTRKTLDQAWKSWIDCIKGDDTNSIFQQITLMIWDTAIFHLILESRNIQIGKNPGEPAINGSLHSFIDRNYFYSQAAFIRRLCDKSSGLTGARGVYSIRSLIGSLQEYRNELTREAFLNLKNMPYDYSDIKRRRSEFFNNLPPGKAINVPREYDWETIEETHRIFDRLSGKTSDMRQPDDVIPNKIYIRLGEKLDVCHNITIFMDKFIAHSAAPESRSVENANESEFTLRQLWDAQRIVFELAEFLSSILFSEDHMALPIENPSFFQYWEAPFINEQDIDRIRIALEKYRKETEEWNRTALDKTWEWIEK